MQMETSSKGNMKSTSPLYAPTILESSLHTKMGFLRRYFAAVFGEFFLLAAVCSAIMLTPIARFYITENDWIMYLLCFTFIVSYMSLVYFAKLPVIARVLFTHIIVQACAIGVFVTYHDLMYVYEAVLISTCSMLVLFLYTLQPNWNFSIWVAIFINISCIYFTSTFLRALFGGTVQENGLTVLFSIFIMFYHSYAIFVIMNSLTPSDYIYALINVHTLPINVVAFSACILKPTK